MLDTSLRIVFGISKHDSALVTFFWKPYGELQYRVPNSPVCLVGTLDVLNRLKKSTPESTNGRILAAEIHSSERCPVCPARSHNAVQLILSLS